jgi:hypothetical protein
MQKRLPPAAHSCYNRVMQKLPRLLITTLVLFALSAAASAGDKRKKKEKEVEHHTPVIASVTPTAIAIKEAKLERSIGITPATEIYVRGQKADVAALQPGMAVDITLAMDGQKASRINAGDPPVHREIKKVKPIRSFMK